MEGPLIERYDALLLDLDGVVYEGGQVIPHAAECLAKARGQLKLAYVTNNASRTPQQVAQILGGMGITTVSHDVVTSAQAGARLLLERGHAQGSPILVVGGEGLTSAVEERGFRVVEMASESPVAVIQGFSPAIDWTRLAEATYAIRQGADYVATNTDLTIPTDRGIAPGNGLLVHAVATASGVEPVVAGKPEPPLMLESVERVGAHRPLVVGDRLDTDIAGARGAGIDSLLVLSGVTDVLTLLLAPPSMRPTFVGRDLRALFATPKPSSHIPTAAQVGADEWLEELAATCRSFWAEEIADEQHQRQAAMGLARGLATAE